MSDLNFDSNREGLFCCLTWLLLTLEVKLKMELFHSNLQTLNLRGRRTNRPLGQPFFFPILWKHVFTFFFPIEATLLSPIWLDLSVCVMIVCVMCWFRCAIFRSKWAIISSRLLSDSPGCDGPGLCGQTGIEFLQRARLGCPSHPSGGSLHPRVRPPVPPATTQDEASPGPRLDHFLSSNARGRVWREEARTHPK